MLIVDKQIAKAEEQILQIKPEILGHVEFFMAPAHLARFLSQKHQDYFPGCILTRYSERSRGVGKRSLGSRSSPGSVSLYCGPE